MQDLNRIVHKADVMGGKPCISGTRVTVAAVVGRLGTGSSVDDVLQDYPYLEREDVLQAIRYAAWLSEEREVVLISA